MRDLTLLVKEGKLKERNRKIILANILKGVYYT
jgi:hypothetical protein